MTKTTQSSYSAPALTRGLKILEIVSKAPTPLSTQEIAAELGRNRNEVFRMIAVLEAEGFLEKSGAGFGYVTTSKLLEMGLNSPRIKDILEAISPMADQFSHLTGAPCQLVLASGDEMVVMKRWEPPLRMSISVPIGSRRPLEDSASGIVMLCAMNPFLFSETEARILQRNPDFQAKDLDAYRSELSQNGVLRFNSRFMEGIVDLSVPLVSLGGQLHGALTVPYANNATCEAAMEEIEAELLKIRNSIATSLLRA
ncbi:MULTISPECIES: IclR family transcriptional regulator [unclassified Shimia]|uniref:IclR family transcriptional regulator n=1 Tax=unclassified Shimia TaxID=2630038 RepID=UPI001ADB5E3B|nr:MULTISPECIES: helix-turn-helix domain-containing protein [unclassified Shimia]MBO9475221.1 helix-turn-helix domain-containing protein [Shimia sp. R10_1]MDA5557786.1 helix-turn-helix domain-containing protein [Shimia sp. MMG029]